MKILVISHTYIAPINRDKWKTFATLYPHDEIKVLFPSQWPTHLFTHEAKNVTQDNMPNCQFIAMSAFKVGNEVLYGYHIKPLYRLIKTFAPDVIQVEQGDNAFSYFQVIMLAKLLRLKAKILFFTWVNWQAHFSLKYRLIWCWIEKINLLASDGAIAGNRDARCVLQKKNFNKPMLVLPQLGVNQQIFTPKPKHPKKLKCIGYIGRLVEEKGVQLLLEAFVRLEREFLDWHLMIVGRGPMLDKLEQCVIRYNLCSKVHFLPPVLHHEVASLINKLDILVLPSYDTPDWKEQFGHILIEAMACGVSVIGSSAGEIPHVIQDAGLIFEQKNLQSLLASLQTLMQDEELRKLLGEKGIECVAKHYSHQAIANETHAFWHSLVV
jgi:glycosyltransferase involved in cell wall biosynthesis